MTDGRRTEDRRLESIEKKLDAHGDKLDTINETLKTIAVQDERIKNHSREISEIKDKQSQCETKLLTVCQFQASCPRGQIKALWAFVVPVALSMLALGWRFLQG